MKGIFTMSLNLPLQKGGGDWNAVYEGSERAPVQGYAPLSDAAGVTVALAVSYGDKMDDRDAAIRDQIILAVNSHDELVAALKQAADVLATPEIYTQWPVSAIRMAIDAALSRAEQPRPENG